MSHESIVDRLAALPIFASVPRNELEWLAERGELRTIEANTVMREGLAAYGIDRSKFPVLAKEAAQQWTATFNPRPITAEDFQQLYEEVFG